MQIVYSEQRMMAWTLVRTTVSTIDNQQFKENSEPYIITPVDPVCYEPCRTRENKMSS